MTYPCVKPWLEYRRISETEYEVDNCLVIGDWDADPPTLPSEIVVFMRSLDGQTNPHYIDRSLTKAQVKEYLQTLDAYGFLREKYRNHDMGRFVFPIVRLDGKPRYSRMAVIINRLLMLLWLPFLIGGVAACVHTAGNIAYSSFALTVGVGLGLLLGAVLHELAHFTAGRAYMAPIYELGVTWKFLLPMAYTYMNTDMVKSRMKRVQILGAGTEASLFFAGCCGLLSAIIPSGAVVQTIFFYAAIENAALGVFSMCFFAPFDGFKMISILLGADDMLFSILSTWIGFRLTWNDQKEKGSAGIATIACTVLMTFAQLIPIIYLLFVLSEVTL